MHHYIADLMERRRDLRPSILTVRYEDLCASPHATLREVLDHCGLPAEEAFLAEAAGRLHQPTYYRPRFSAADLAIIAEETAKAAARFGYRVDRVPALRQSAE
jgi:crotonobetainyl-CoA:carnitine CoA-transferase CaiB-like acyl-CoA transferase